MQNLDDLKKYLSFPSISTVDKYKGDIENTAVWLKEYLENLGFESRVMPSEGSSVVYAQGNQIAGRKTLLVYGHYDVQPVDPVSEWSVDPFSGDEKDGYLYGRGTSDNKGQFWCHILAIQEYQKEGKDIPVNLKFLLEGEEEIGSPNLEKFILENKELLECDIAWISDGSAYKEEAATIDAGLRGCVNCEIKVFGPKQDLHSGSYGGSIANPLAVLVQVLSGMQDEQGKVLLPGFYDGVVPISEASKNAVEIEPFDENEFLERTGSLALTGESEFNTQERIGLRPTLQITGVSGGYAEEGYKNIVPKEAVAKLNVRIVKGQNWERVRTMIKEYLEKSFPDLVKWEASYDAGNDAYLVDPSSPVIIQAKKAFDQVFDAETIVRFEGGSLPVTGYLSDILTENVLLSGWAQEMHVVDEKISLNMLEKGVKAIQVYWEELK